MPVSTALILSWMLKLSPSVPHQAFPEIAQAINDIALSDPDPLDAAASLTAIGRFESNFDLYAVSPSSDPAHAVGMFQISTVWLRLPASPHIQAAVALNLLRDSQLRCGSIAMYTSGKCGAGRDAGDERMKLAAKLKFTQFVILEPVLPVMRKKK